MSANFIQYNYWFIWTRESITSPWQLFKYSSCHGYAVQFAGEILSKVTCYYIS